MAKHLAGAFTSSKQGHTVWERKRVLIIPDQRFHKDDLWEL